ncbi:MAG: hypothetical protein HXX20_15930 [Chloroflexi bacterium]|nr:hypothetical protein [Chloroflexota bacterium]
MNMNLAPKDEAYLKSKVEAGYYVNMAEAIRDAIRRMREVDEQKGEYDNAMYAAVLKGEEQYAKGQYEEYTPELRQKIQRNARLKAQQGVRPKADVLP